MQEVIPRMAGCLFRVARSAGPPFILRLRHAHRLNVHSGKYLNTTAVCSGDQEGAPHFRRSSVAHPLSNELKLKLDDEHSYTLPHPIWSKEEAEAVKVTHEPPVSRTDKVGIIMNVTPIEVRSREAVGV